MSAPVILWFRQDLRLSDHPALAAAAAEGPVLPAYVLDDDTPGRWRWGAASRWWLHHTLDRLGRSAPLWLGRGEAVAVLERLAEATGAKAIYFTRDYAPWSGRLEAAVQAMCARRGMVCRRFGGFLLHEPEALRTGAGQPYKVYTPFARAAFAAGEPKPAKQMPATTWHQTTTPGALLANWRLTPTRPDWAKGFDEFWQPGETGAQRRLAGFLDQGLGAYADERDRPDREAISRLSPHLHWGEVGPAQVWRAVRQRAEAAGGALDRAAEKFLKELLWREFSYHLLQHWPDLPETPFRADFAAFPWSPSEPAISAWRRGETGYPIVDAGMRELWTTGFMHNRVRMIAASFLIKHLLTPWQTGEAWFWDTLVDADIGNNAASWQLVAGSGADAAPYFRIFNPVLQGEKFDPEGRYVRRHLPELAGLDARAIHRPWEAPKPPKDYPAPIVDHATARARAMAAFKSLGRDTT